MVFKINSSTNTPISKLTDNILKVLNEGRQLVGILCDIAKAFDSVSHDILLDKHCHFGIQGTVLLWFRSYLEQRNRVLEYCIINLVKLLQVGKQ